MTRLRVGLDPKICPKCQRALATDSGLRSHMAQACFGGPVEARFWSKVNKDGPNSCWVWTGTTSRGYGHQRVSSTRSRLVHIMAYEWAMGPVPAGLELDHLCRVRACVNPAHLEAVTSQENNRRAKAVKTHCPQGHPYTGDNLLINHGARVCRECSRASGRRYHQKLRAPA